MVILNYTTKIDSEKTVAEIQNSLRKGGCKKIIVDYDDDGNPSIVSFSINWNGAAVFFQLPCKTEGVYKVLQKNTSAGSRPWMKTKDQAYRVAWRIIKDWVEAQMSLVSAEQATIAEVFLPYAITKSGSTLFNELNSDNSQLLLG